MKVAEDFRSIARVALSGKWKIAVLVGLVATLLGAVEGMGPEVRVNIDAGNVSASFEYAGAKFLRTIYVLLWSLLFVIPGIIASFSYAMTDYILAENPEMSASEAISRSKEMMEGNRFRLFCLEFSFIGWSILCAFTLGIGNLWLTPYRQAATAAFYREVSGTEYRAYDNDWE